ncbi:MAG TPA: EAL domain-containing protein, partial [Burkholderiaceae bacterium]|nr:EAL domain-containing protein [Burkholderiaceae bacterium]
AQSLATRSRKIQRIVDQRTADLVTANAHLRARENAIEASINGIIIANATAPHHVIEYVNPAVEKISGFSAAELIGSGCGKLWTGGRDQPGVRKIVDAVNSLEPVRAPLQTRRKDGTAYWAEVQIAPVRDESGRVDRFVVAMHDVTENKRYEAELEYLSKHDELTELASPSLLRDRLQLAIENARSDDSAIWVTVIDLDRFKFVNDSLGRRAGDRFLKTIAQRIKSATRKEDTVGRLGGDEFLLILPQSKGGKTGGSIVQGVMDAVAEPIRIDRHELLLTCSAGMALFPNDGSTVDELIERADIALHNAKAYGPNSMQFFTAEMHAVVQERLLLESALRTALERSELDLHYQPQVDLLTGRVVGMEALVRWNHPTLGEIPPSQFIAVAEECGVITSIGTWVLRTACRQARVWQQAGFGDLRIAVNISARQFIQPGLAGMIASVLDETQLPGNLLDIELTERLIMRDAEHTIDSLNALRALGVQLSIDDFGTGYSSLAYLKRFPIDVLKIDQSFVREISHDANDAAISDAIISMAHSLGIRVIAEGVETEAQCEYLTRNMCDEIQGYLFSKPLPAAQVELLLAEQKCLPARLLRMHKRPRTLLLVDDEPNILASLKRLLRGGGYRILTASSGQDGLDLLAQNDVDVIMSDQRMPGMTGVEFLRAVKTSYPDTVRIVLSGFTELKSVTDAVNEGAIYKFLTKPWDDVLLRAHIEEAFQHKEMADENHRLSLEVRTANHSLATANRQLEELLRQKRQQIERDKSTLDSVRETLQHIPLPIIGLGEDDIVTFANIAAQNLFKDARELPGSEAAHVMPEVLHLVRNSDNGSAQNAELGGVHFEVISRAMMQDGQPRGKLITLIPGDFA